MLVMSMILFGSTAILELSAFQGRLWDARAHISEVAAIAKGSDTGKGYSKLMDAICNLTAHPSSNILP